jgi:DNA repair exonuclease SbcCD nuclease subunit
MKVAIITDQHFGARKNSKVFHDYFLEFYDKVFFPTLEKENIRTVIDMGDTFDSRKGIDFSALSWAKNNYYDKLQKMDVKVHTVVGNHTSYYKNTNEVNAVDLLLREYENVTIYSESKEIQLDKLKVLLVPWINTSNEQKTFQKIQNTNATVAMGHLELNGFYAHKGHVMDCGMDTQVYDKFQKVFSGHYHTRSNNGKIFYLGNPYEIYWNDLNDKRGFHIFDTETLEHIPVDNPFRMFYSLYYEDTPYQTLNSSMYEGKIVKVVVRKKTDSKQFEKFIDKLFESNVHDLKVVETLELPPDANFEAEECEDTLSILNRYVEESETQMDKSKIINLLQTIYKEACEMV